MKYLIPALVFCVVLIPSVVSAQSGLVPQCGASCNWCDFVDLVNNLITWLIRFLSVLAVIILVIAGFKMVTSGGNTQAWESAKSMFTNVVIGIILVLAAWLIVDTLLATLTEKGGINEWLPDDCGVQHQAVRGSSGGGSSSSGGLVVGGDEDEVRQQLLGMGYQINKASCNGQRYQDVDGGCTSVGGFTSGMLGALSRVSSNCTNCTLVITGGSEAGHQTHGDGNSVDFRFTPNLNSYIDSGGAANDGLNCVREYNPPHWHCRH